jgi:hypothetical protein
MDIIAQSIFLKTGLIGTKSSGESSRTQTRNGNSMYKGRPYAIHVHRTVDMVTQILFSVVAGLFLLSPVIIMPFISSEKYLLVKASLSVLPLRSLCP